jgi:hypothetical protein
MIKKSILISLSLLTVLNAAPIVERTKDNSSLSYNNEGKFEYDATKGWWWYKQKIKDKEGKEIEIKEKFSTKEKLKMEKQNSLIKELKIQSSLIKKQNKKLDKVKERLEYAFPNLTPIYTKNKKTGEKCLTNSKAECFVFPLQAEAQHVPVMANWLSDPSPTNSKEWLRWEAKYFNHITKISYGNRFAFLSGGPNVYPTQTTFVYNDNIAFPASETTQKTREAQIILSLKDKLELKIFIGANTFKENTIGAYKRFRHFTHKPWSELKYTIYVPTKEDLKLILTKVSKMHGKKVQEFWKNANIEVGKNNFKKFKITSTPSIVALYKTDKKNKEGKKEIIWQNINIGTTGAVTMRKSLIRFLIYNDIINPAELSAAVNDASVQKNMFTQKPKINEKDIYKDNNKINEVEK